MQLCPHQDGLTQIVTVLQWEYNLVVDDGVHLTRVQGFLPLFVEFVGKIFFRDVIDHDDLTLPGGYDQLQSSYLHYLLTLALFFIIPVLLQISELQKVCHFVDLSIHLGVWL